jgi:hypothetical protein
MKRLAIVFAILLGVALLFVGSYFHARARADALVAGRPDAWFRISSRFCLFSSITGHPDPSWEFSYDPRDTFPTAPLTIQMSLLGQPVATNPRNALAELQRPP